MKQSHGLLTWGALGTTGTTLITGGWSIHPCLLAIDIRNGLPDVRGIQTGRMRMEAAVCGIDPGLGTTGYAVLRAGAVIDAGVCRFDADRPLAERLLAIEVDIAAILAEHSPDVVAVEQLYSHYKHPRTAILMGHARGVILLSAARRGIPVHSYSATQIKRYLTGNGRATKSQMQRAVALTLGLQSQPEPADVADALAIAMCGAADLTRGGCAPGGIAGSWAPATAGRKEIKGISAARRVAPVELQS